MNTELLFKLYAIHSLSGGEKKMRRFIRKYISVNCGDVKMDTDEYGNLLCVKGESKTYPCLASHMDQVQRNHSKDFEVITNGDVCFGFSMKSHDYQGLGADDKNGIFICLECLRTFDVLKVAFFVGEEVGCKGSSRVDMEFFKDCRFIIEPDRRGSSDLITSMFCGEVCSEKFIKDIGYEAYGYKEDEGTVTDVGELVERGVGISCLNLSCGYYEAHTDYEFTIMSELQNCLDFVMHIVSECREVYPFEGGYGGYGRGYGRYGRYSSNVWCNYGNNAVKSSIVKSPGLTSSQTEQKSQYGSSFYVDEWDEYISGGYYDEDYDLMFQYLKEMPDLQFESISVGYLDNFWAATILNHSECIANLRDIYNYVKEDLTSEMLYSHDDFWGDDDDTVFPMKKVS